LLGSKSLFYFFLHEILCYKKQKDPLVLNKRIFLS
jgi:hypothetical protein